MKFTLKTSELKRVLPSMQKVIKEKGPIAAAENVLVEIKDGRISFLATNLESYISDSIALDGELEGENIGAFLINPRYIVELLKEYNGETISFETADKNVLVCTFGQGQYKLSWLDATEFPLPEKMENPFVLNVNQADLLDAISQTIVACADDEMRPALGGILFDIKTSGLTLVASDSKELVCRDVDLGGTLVEEEARIIVHSKGMSILKGLIDKKSEDAAVIEYTGRGIRITLGTLVFTSKLVVAKFPKYEDVFPKDNEICVTFPREELVNAIKRVSVCSSKVRKTIKLSFTAGHVEVASEDINFQVSAKENLVCDYEAEDKAIGMNADALLSILGAVGTEEVTLKINQAANRPIVIVPADNAKAGFRSLLMPIAV